MIIITPDTPLSVVLDSSEKVLEVLTQYGLGCAACIGAQFETVGDACIAHEIDVQKLTDDLTDALAPKK